MNDNSSGCRNAFRPCNEPIVLGFDPVVQRLRHRWSAEFPGGVPATAAISSGVVYAASAVGEVAALRLAAGTEVWRRRLGTYTYGSAEGKRRLGFFSGVALTDDSVLVASEVVYRLDRATGKTVWKSEPLSECTSTRQPALAVRRAASTKTGPPK